MMETDMLLRPWLDSDADNECNQKTLQSRAF